MIYSNKKEIHPLLFINGFVRPVFADGIEEVDVLIKFCGKELLFQGIHVNKFKTNWTVGIDKVPFRDQSVEKEILDQKKYCQYIIFMPDQGDGTEMRVYSKKLK